MNQQESVEQTGDATTLARKSWTAYVRISVVGLLLLMILVPLAWRASIGAGVIALLLVLAYVVYSVLTIRSYHLFCDDMGIWLSSGILPWNSGTVGVKWRDLDEAVVFQNIWSWMFRSYTIHIGHRFTKSSEIVLTHMAGGHDAVMQVNQLHQELVRQNRLA